MAPFEENFRAAGVLVPANAGVPRILVVHVAVSEENRGNHLRVINGAGQACFESPQSMKGLLDRSKIAPLSKIRRRGSEVQMITF